MFATLTRDECISLQQAFSAEGSVLARMTIERRTRVLANLNEAIRGKGARS